MTPHLSPAKPKSPAPVIDISDDEDVEIVNKPNKDEDIQIVRVIEKPAGTSRSSIDKDSFNSEYEDVVATILKLAEDYILHE